MNRFAMIIVTGLLLGSPHPLWAQDHKHDAKVSTAPAQPTLKSNQAAVDVHGVVCSICAYGLDKRLSKLSFLDRSQFKKGVLIDIYKHTVTLALAPDKPVHIKQIHDAIVDGGYKPVTFFLRVSGTVERQGDSTLLRRGTGEVFQLSGERVDQLVTGQGADVQITIDAKHVASLKADQPIQGTVTRIGGDAT